MVLLFPLAVQKPTMKLLIVELYNEVASKYRVIGLMLNLSPSTIQDLENCHRGDPSECLLDVLTKWLQQVDPPASWEDIIKALHIVQRQDIAERLRYKYCRSNTEVGYSVTHSIVPIIRQTSLNCLICCLYLVHHEVLRDMSIFVHKDDDGFIFLVVFRWDILCLLVVCF